MPFSDTADLHQATAETGEWFPCYWSTQSAWYSYTADADKVLEIDTQGSTSSFPAVHVFRDTGGGLSGLGYVSCTSGGQPAILRAQAGVTYYFQAVAGYGYGGSVKVNVAEVPRRRTITSRTRPRFRACRSAIRSAQSPRRRRRASRTRAAPRPH